MPIPTYQQFKNATTIRATNLGSGLKKVFSGRGSNMALIDTALKAWEKVSGGNDAAAKAKALNHIISTTSWWLNLKANKQSELSVQRRLQISALKSAAMQELQQLDQGQAAFAQKKSDAILLGSVAGTADKKKKTVHFQGIGTKGLAAGYQPERDTYVGLNKQMAIAAGKIHDKFDGEWSNVTVQDYVDIYNQMRESERRGAEVAYLSKAERVQYLVVIMGNTCQRVDGTPMHSTDSNMAGRTGDMWAMDRYGNLFVKDCSRIKGKAYFNHSSFTAGTDVYCAGVILFNPGGQLVYIDNASGHYKPDRMALHSAVSRLQAEGLPMNDVRVSVFLGEGVEPASYKAATFLANPNAQPDWDPNDNARLQMPDYVGV